MARHKSLNPPSRLNIAIDANLKTRLEVILFSESAGRVPVGAWQKMVESCLNERLSFRRQPLEQYGFPPGYFITGPEEMIKAVMERLEND